MSRRHESKQADPDDRGRRRDHESLRVTQGGGAWFADDGAHRKAENQRGRGPKGYRRPDSRIEEDVNALLTEDRDIDASVITVTVEDGEVTLGGTVFSRSDKYAAEDCAESVRGVRHIQNNLRVLRRLPSRRIGDLFNGM